MILTMILTIDNTMKRLFILLALFSCLVTEAQIPADTGSLRRKINTDIVTNGSKAITATNLNNILIGITNLMKAYAIDSAYRIADTIFLTRRGGFTTIKVTLNSGGAPTETDPTVSAAAKNISSSDISFWNAKQQALVTGSGITLTANFITANKDSALWNAGKLNGNGIADTIPTNGQVLTWNGTYWVPRTPANGSVPNLSQVLAAGASIGATTRTIKGNGIIDLLFDSLHNYEIRYGNRVKIYADGGQASLWLGPTYVKMIAADSVFVQGSGKFSVQAPTSLYGSLTITGLGAPVSDTNVFAQAVFNKSTGAMGQMDHWVVGSPGGSGMTNPMSSAGDIIYGGSGGSPLRLPAGTSHGILHSGTTPGWGPVDVTTEISGVVPISHLASGTPDGTKYVRDDGTLAVPPGVGLSGLTAGRISVANSGTTITDYSGFTYNNASHSLSADTVVHKKAKTDTVQFASSVLVPNGAMYWSFGDSFTAGSNASPFDSAYNPRISAYYHLPMTNFGVSGSSIVPMTQAMYANINYPHKVFASLMVGFNNVRTQGNDMTDFNMIMQGYKACYLNHFMKNYTPAGDASVVQGGSWTAPQDIRGYGGKSTNGAFTTSSGAYLEWSFTDSTVGVGMIGHNGSVSSVNVSIDGVFVETVNRSGQADAPTNSAALVRYYQGLTYGTHTIRITANSGGLFLVDYFCNMVTKNEAQTLLFYEIPKMNAAGYALGPAHLTAATFDSANAKLDSLFATFRVYPCYIVPTNTFFNTATDVDLGDNVHPSNLGHRHLAQGGEAQIGSSLLGIQDGAMFYANGSLHFNSAGIIKQIVDGDVVYNGGQPTYGNMLRIGSNEPKATAILSGGDTIAYFINGVNKAEIFGPTRIWGTVQAETGAVLLTNSITPSLGVTAQLGSYGLQSGLMLTRNTGVTDENHWMQGPLVNKYYHYAVSDAGATVSYMTISRTGVNIDSVNFPNGHIMIGHMPTSSTMDSVVRWNRSTRKLEYGPMGGGAAWGSITGTLSSQSDLNTALGLKAPLASPSLTGTPTAPTASAGTNTTQIATTAFVRSQVAQQISDSNAANSTVFDSQYFSSTGTAPDTLRTTAHPFDFKSRDSIVTTSTSLATIATYGYPLSTDGTGQMTVVIMGADASDPTKYFKQRTEVGWHKSSGTMTVENTDNVFTPHTSGLGSPSISITASGGNILVKVTPGNSNTTNWKVIMISGAIPLFL
jgi:hypothetical protein